MNTSNVLVLVLQTGFVLLATLAAGLAFRRSPVVRLALFRASLVAVLALAIASPWFRERSHPVIPVRWEPTMATAAPAPRIATSPHTKEVAAVADASALASPRPAERVIDPMQVAIVIWAAGVALLALHLGLGYGRLARIRRVCKPVDDEHVRATLTDIAHQAGIPVPGVVEGDAVGNPFVAGVLRPTVFLPLGWRQEVDEETLRAVLRHEMAHIANGDLRWSLLHRLACIVLWPQPLLWLLRRPISVASEELCDRHVLASGIPSARYAECLLNLREGLRSRPCPSLGIGAVSVRSALGKRVEAILDSRRSRTVVLPRPVAIFLRMGAIALAVGAVVLFAKPVASSADGQDPFANWILKPYSGSVRILSPDGKPVVGATAWLVFSGEVPEPNSRRLEVVDSEAVLPKDGPFPQIRGTLVVQAKGYGLAYIQAWPAPKPVTEIQLPVEAALEGRLLLPNGGSAAGVEVAAKLFIRRSSGPMGFSFLQLDPAMGLSLSTTTAADGSFRIEGLPPKTSVGYDVDDQRFAGLRYADRVDMSPSGTTTAKPVTLVLAASMSGRVLRNGKPVAGLYIGAQGNTDKGRDNADLGGRAVTDKDGRYMMGRLPYGVYNIMPDLRDPLSQEVTAVAHEAVVLTAGQGVTGLDFDLIPGVVIQGRVTDEAGKPLPKVHVGVYGPAHPMSSAWVQGVQTDQDGRYRLRVPPGKQHVYLADSRYEQDPRDIDVAEGTTINFRAKPAKPNQFDFPSAPAEEAAVALPQQPDDGAAGPPVASFGPGKPFYGPLKLANGATVRLAYVQDDMNGAHTIWKPDGTPADPGDVAGSLNTEGFANKKGNPRSMFLRVDIAGAQRGEYNCVVEVPHRSNWSVWQTYGDPDDRSMDLASFHAPDTLEVTDMKFGVAAGPYRIVRAAKLGEPPLFANASEGPVGPSPGRGPGVSISVQVPSGLDGRDVRLEAYDASGRKLELASWETEDTVGRDGRRTRAFGFSGGGANISRVELLARDYQWAIFKGIHLHPQSR